MVGNVARVSEGMGVGEMKRSGLIMSNDVWLKVMEALGGSPTGIVPQEITIVLKRGEPVHISAQGFGGYLSDTPNPDSIVDITLK